MKPIAIAFLVAAAGFSATAARADHSRVNIDVGISIGSNRNVPVYVEPAPVVVAPVGHRHYAPSRGYWDTVTVKTWIPGRWVVTHNRWGRPHRFFERGHYVYRTERVWVDAHRRNRAHAYHHNGGHRRWNR